MFEICINFTSVSRFARFRPYLHSTQSSYYYLFARLDHKIILVSCCRYWLKLRKWNSFNSCLRLTQKILLALHLGEFGSNWIPNVVCCCPALHHIISLMNEMWRNRKFAAFLRITKVNYAFVMNRRTMEMLKWCWIKVDKVTTPSNLFHCCVTSFQERHIKCLSYSLWAHFNSTNVKSRM